MVAACLLREQVLMGSTEVRSGYRSINKNMETPFCKRSIRLVRNLVIGTMNIFSTFIFLRTCCFLVCPNKSPIQAHACTYTEKQEGKKGRKNLFPSHAHNAGNDSLIWRLHAPPPPTKTQKSLQSFM